MSDAQGELIKKAVRGYVYQRKDMNYSDISFYKKDGKIYAAISWEHKADEGQNGSFELELGSTLEGRNIWTMFRDSPGRHEPRDAAPTAQNLAEQSPAELTEITRFGQLHEPQMDSNVNPYYMYQPPLEIFMSKIPQYEEMLFDTGSDGKVRIVNEAQALEMFKNNPGQYFHNPWIWGKVINENFIASEIEKITEMWYGIRYSPDRESPIRSEVQEAADMFWTEYLRRNPHVPVDKLSEVGLAQFRRTVSLLAQPKGDPRGGGAAHLGGGGGFYFYYFNNTRYGDLPFANPVNSHWGVGAHENEHLLGQKLSKSNPDFAQGPQGRILRLITFETAPVIAQRLMGLKVLQLATGMKYSGGFQGILKDDFRGPSEYTVFLPTLAKKGEYIQPKNYPSHEMIRILEDGFGITRPGMGQIQKKLNTDLVFQKFMVGQLKMLLARHKKMGAKMYPFQEIRNEALSAFDDK